MASITNYSTTGQKVVPSAGIGNGVNVTPNGTAWVNSGWQEVTSGISTGAIAIAGLAVVRPSTGGALDAIFDIGTGTAGNEAVIATLAGGFATAAGSFLPLKLVIPVKVLVNTRISVRMRKGGVVQDGWQLKILYYDIPPVVVTRRRDHQHPVFLYAL